MTRFHQSLESELIERSEIARLTRQRDDLRNKHAELQAKLAGSKTSTAATAEMRSPTTVRRWR